MRYAVTLRGQRGALDVVHVEAISGDEAAEKAFRPHHVILSVQPDQVLELTEVVKRGNR